MNRQWFYRKEKNSKTELIYVEILNSAGVVAFSQNFDQKGQPIGEGSFHNQILPFIKLVQEFASKIAKKEEKCCS